MNILAGDARARSGPAATENARTASQNKIVRDFTVTRTWWDAVVDFLGGNKFSIQLRFGALAELRVGEGNLRVVVGILDAAGRSLVPPKAVQHSYALKSSSSDPNQIDISKDGAVWKTISNPGSFRDEFTLPGVALKSGSYKFQSELNLDDKADGHTELSAASPSTLTY